MNEVNTYEFCFIRMCFSHTQTKALPYAKSQGRALTIGSACINSVVKGTDLLRRFIQRSPPNNRNQPMMAIHSGQLKAMPHASPFNKLRFISTNNDSFHQGDSRSIGIII